MCAKSDQAAELYKKAYSMEQKGETNVAEVYYLKSWSLFEQAGGSHYLNAANALNSLAFLRWSQKNYEGALCSAKHSLRIMETHGTGYAGADAELILNTSWDLIHQINQEMLVR